MAEFGTLGALTPVYPFKERLRGTHIGGHRLELPDLAGGRPRAVLDRRAHRYEALHQLVRSEGIEEVIVLATCNRTEFIVWASDVPAAANSVFRFLTQEYQLKLCDWSHFYRLMDDVALTHVFQVASGLDSMVLGEPEITGRCVTPGTQARKAGTRDAFWSGDAEGPGGIRTGPVRNAIGSSAVYFSLRSGGALAGVLGDLTGREVLLMGAGKMSELAAKYLLKAGRNNVKVMNRTLAHAEELARSWTPRRSPFEDRLAHLKTADIVVQFDCLSHTYSQPPRGEAVARARQHKPMVMIDIAVPRDIDPGRAGG